MVLARSRVTLIIKLGNRLRELLPLTGRQSRCYSCANKTVTSAGHDEERIGAFVSEGKAANQQSTDTVPTQAADTSANTGKFTLRVILLFQKARPRKSNLLAPYNPSGGYFSQARRTSCCARFCHPNRSRRLCGCLSWGCASRRRVGDRASSSGQR